MDIFRKPFIDSTEYPNAVVQLDQNIHVTHFLIPSFLAYDPKRKARLMGFEEKNVRMIPLSLSDIPWDKDKSNHPNRPSGIIVRHLSPF
jgi:hypothetical protein